MANVKIVLRSETKLDGTSPLAIRITKDRKSSYVYLEYSIKKTDWDKTNQRVKKSHPNSGRLNNYLITKMAEVVSHSLEMETEKKEVSSRAVRQKVKSKNGVTFFIQAATHIANLRAGGKYNQVVSDEPRINKFKEFLGGSDIPFHEITVPLLNRFKAYLKGERNVSERTVMNYFILIRTVFNQAIKGKLVDPKYYPFGRNGIVIKFPDSIKIGLTPAEVKKIEELELPQGSAENHARNVWLFSYYFAGMRVSDVLRLKRADFQNERLFYAMGKNAKAGSLKVPDKALRIISQYEPNDQDLLFPDLLVVEDLENAYEVQRKISYAVKQINTYLVDVAKAATISKPLTMHIARHTFGNISGDKIPVQMLQKLYRHSSITTTIGYQANFIHKDADDALAAVIGI
ncbi:MAG: site-specific integrase [Chitinophagaceae bacterium]|nr:site-specific integrase [Chitinophagaceae bacterium]